MYSRTRRTALASGIIGTVLAASLLTTSGTALGNIAHPGAAQKNAQHPAKAMTKVHFILNWLPNVEFAGVWAAQRFGWFKRAGIDMTFTSWTPSVHPETDVPSHGGNTFGFQSGAAIIQAVAKGANDVALYTDTQRSVFGLTVLNSAHINKIKDLNGKRVGYQADELYVPQTMLSYAGVKQWRPVTVSFDITPLTAGQVDAFLTFLTNEPIALKMRGVGVHSFRAADFGFHFYDDVMFTTQTLISKNPALVRKVTQLVAKGFKWAHTHPDIAAKMVVNNYFPASTAGPGISAAQNLKQQTLELRKFKEFSADSKGRYTGLMNTKQWQESIDTLFRYHEITKKPAAAAMYTNTFNPYVNGGY